MFRFKFGKKAADRERHVFDPEKEAAVLRCSICNGEQVAGFRNLETGKFTEVCLIHNYGELEDFMEEYGLTDIRKEY